jgi:hypothetical protein
MVQTLRAMKGIGELFAVLALAHTLIHYQIHFHCNSLLSLFLVNSIYLRRTTDREVDPKGIDLNTLLVVAI